MSVVVTTILAATRDSSNLLAHEAAFALGQMQDVEAIPALENVLNDMSLHPIVRHEVTEPCIMFCGILNYSSPTILFTLFYYVYIGC